MPDTCGWVGNAGSYMLAARVDIRKLSRSNFTRPAEDVELEPMLSHSIVSKRITFLPLPPRTRVAITGARVSGLILTRYAPIS